MSANPVDAPDALRLTHVLPAAPDRVFDAWTREEHRLRWACPKGATLLSAESDLRVGGLHRLCMDVGGVPHTAYGVYREIDRPRRLVYTWDWEEEDQRMGETLVTVEFVPVEGGTEVRLVHSGFPAPESRDGHGEGWASCLERLEELLARGGPDRAAGVDTAS